MGWKEREREVRSGLKEDELNPFEPTEMELKEREQEVRAYLKEDDELNPFEPTEIAQHLDEVLERLQYEPWDSPIDGNRINVVRQLSRAGMTQEAEQAERWLNEGARLISNIERAAGVDQRNIPRWPKPKKEAAMTELG